MNKQEYLLSCLAEECNEIAQRVSKALRFTLEECQPGQDLSNGHRITQELIDLLGVVETLVDEDIIEDPKKFRDGIEIKKAKIEKYMAYSRKVGALT